MKTCVEESEDSVTPVVVELAVLKDLITFDIGLLNPATNDARHAISGMTARSVLYIMTDDVMMPLFYDNDL